ncbi:MAG: APC family permease [Gammaproteobacteria bacterium]
MTVSQAVGLALTIVIGAGLLVLPGLAYQQAGGAALYVWILDLVLVAPLLVIFAKLGAKWPGAGGVAGFLQNAFSRRWGAAAEVLLVGTFGLGIPAIALTGGQYCAAATGAGNDAVPMFAFILLLAAAAVNWRGAGVSGDIQRTLAFVLCGVLFAAALLALIFGDRSRGEPIAAATDIDTWRAALPAAGLVFFAFTGWEMMSFTSEEYRNPRRDFPLAVGVSFAVVALLYLTVAAAVQLTLPRDAHQTSVAPLAALLAPVSGAAGAVFVSAAAAVILFANLIGAMWAASRLVFSSAREGLLPRAFAALSSRRTPRAAIAVCLAVFCVALAAEAAGIWKIDDMLRLAGQNFFFLYAMSVAAYLRIASTVASRLLGAASLAVSVAMMGVFGLEMLYPVFLLAVGALWHSRIKRRAEKAAA